MLIKKVYLFIYSKFVFTLFNQSIN